MWLNIAAKLVPGMIKTGMSIAANRRKAKELESVAEMNHAQKMADGQIEYKKAVMNNQNQGWKDELVLIIVVLPIVVLSWSVFSGDPQAKEKLELTQEQNMTNKVNIQFLRDQLDKALADVEDLKDKVRQNGNSY